MIYILQSVHSSLQLDKRLLMYVTYVTTTQIKIQKIFVTPENSFVPLPRTTPTSTATTTLTCILIGYMYLSLASCVWNHMLDTLLCLVSLVQQNVFEIYSCSYLNQYFSFYCYIVFHFTSIPFYEYTSICFCKSKLYYIIVGHLYCFQFGDITMTAANNNLLLCHLVDIYNDFTWIYT